MRKIIKKIKDSICRAWNDASPKKRGMTIGVFMLLYTALTLYLMLEHTQDVSYEKYLRQDIQPSSILIDDKETYADTLMNKRVFEMKEFFNQFNTISHE